MDFHVTAHGKHWDVSDGDIVLLDSQAVPEPIVEAEDLNMGHLTPLVCFCANSIY